jgi:hypothetical protein
MGSVLFWSHCTSCKGLIKQRQNIPQKEKPISALRRTNVLEKRRKGLEKRNNCELSVMNLLLIIIITFHVSLLSACTS